MQNEIFEQLNQAGKTSYQSFQELMAINTKTLQKLSELQFSLATLSIEGSVEQAKLLTGNTNYKDLLSAESEFASDFCGKVLEITRKTAEVLNESRDEVTAWFEKNVEGIAAVVKPNVKKPGNVKAPVKQVA